MGKVVKDNGVWYLDYLDAEGKKVYRPIARTKFQAERSLKLALRNRDIDQRAIFEKALLDEIEADRLKKSLMAGEERAQRLMCRVFFQDLYAHIFFRVRKDHFKAEEACNDTFLEALNRIEEYQPARYPFEVWLLMLAQKHIDTARRSFAYREKHPLSQTDDEGREWGEVEAPEPLEGNPVQREMSNFVMTVMEALDAKDREILEMFYTWDMTLQQIGNSLNLTKDQVRRRLEFARMSFRQAFRLAKTARFSAA